MFHFTLFLMILRIHGVFTERGLPGFGTGPHLHRLPRRGRRWRCDSDSVAYLDQEYTEGVPMLENHYTCYLPSKYHATASFDNFPLCGRSRNFCPNTLAPPCRCKARADGPARISCTLGFTALSIVLSRLQSRGEAKKKSVQTSPWVKLTSLRS